MSPEDQELARLRAAFAAPAGAAPEPESCPPAEKVWAAVRGELRADETREVVEHVAFCASCAEDWRLAMDLQQQEPARETAAPLAPVVYGRFQRWRPLAAAAAMAAGLLIVIGLQSDDLWGPRTAPTYREAERTAIRSLAEATLPQQGGTLRWSALPGAVSYDLVVSTEDLRVVAEQQGLTATEYRLPASALAGVAPGTKLLWRVDAVMADGRHESSPTFTTTVR
ncbi:MAG TPA: zf-HC2 domain-containing protein [Thermoanaerobaculia bacterium]|nr:zf-HC2 domain-containing protein [Thermoanaerobaculia bacterium]